MASSSWRWSSEFSWSCRACKNSEPFGASGGRVFDALLTVDPFGVELRPQTVSGSHGGRDRSVVLGRGVPLAASLLTSRFELMLELP
ncbi:MAG: hypothetical protein OJJ54_09050 [Pseudonocardia sp.]|nr:hypothetical protein [Pseudonocardia sp.]